MRSIVKNEDSKQMMVDLYVIIRILSGQVKIPDNLLSVTKDVELFLSAK